MMFVLSIYVVFTHDVTGIETHGPQSRKGKTTTQSHIHWGHRTVSGVHGSDDIDIFRMHSVC